MTDVRVLSWRIVKGGQGGKYAHCLVSEFKKPTFDVDRAITTIRKAFDAPAKVPANL